MKRIVMMALCALLAGATVWAAQTALPASVTLGNPYATAPTALAWTGCDTANGNSFIATNRDVLLVWNSDGAATHNFTVTSVSLNGRTGDVSQTASANTYYATQMFPVSGWAQSNGLVYLTCNSIPIKYQVITVP